MKQLFLTLAVALCGCTSYAQWSTSGSNVYYNSGNVGIGTTSPQVPLHVNGTIISATPVSNTVGVGTTWADNANYNFIGYNGYWGLRTATNNGYNLDVYNGGSPITAITVLQGGNVGIGTTSPAYKLQVGSNIWNNLGSNVTLGVAGDLAIGNATPGSQPCLKIIEGTYGYYTLLQKHNGYTELQDAQGVISLNGNVGIGTTSPDTKLAVNGTIPQQRS